MNGEKLTGAVAQQKGYEVVINVDSKGKDFEKAYKKFKTPHWYQQILDKEKNNEEREFSNDN